jgi:hypothetical protein
MSSPSEKLVFNTAKADLNANQKKTRKARESFRACGDVVM